MTDHPRFEPVRSTRTGAPQLPWWAPVNSLLRLVDRWRTRRKLRQIQDCHENQMLTVNSSRCSLGASCGTWSPGPGCSQDRVGTGDQMGASAAICQAPRWRCSTAIRERRVCSDSASNFQVDTSCRRIGTRSPRSPQSSPGRSAWGWARRRTRARPCPAGGQLLRVSPGMTHFAFVDEDTVIQLNSTGPWGLLTSTQQTTRETSEDCRWVERQRRPGTRTPSGQPIVRVWRLR